VPIISFIPLFMFAILFGPSMDYEVFLLSRVREEHLRTGDNGYAVVRAIGVTARTISCGAAIMVSVFVGFGFGDDPVLKMLGLATAVFLDATLVRLVLVPATMKLLATPTGGSRRGWTGCCQSGTWTSRPTTFPLMRSPTRADTRHGPQYALGRSA
jgi:uncharacterized membrane protein YdfJ with MMPL/SSD domain